MAYVIHLFTHETKGRDKANHYGYWTGRTYRYHGNTLPYLTRDVTQETKRYASRKCAENMARKLPDRLDKLVRVLIEEIGEDETS